MRRGGLISPITVGRAAESRELELALEQGRLGRGSVVALAGEAGVGKSRLAADASGSAARAGMRVLRGRAVESSSPIAYRAIASALLPALRAGLPHDDPDLHVYRGALSLLVPEWRGESTPLPSDDSPLAVLEAVSRLLRALAGRNGLLLVIEDAHWADAETLALLDYLADTTAGERVVCLVTVRVGESRQGDALLERLEASAAGSTLIIDRLPSAAVEEMLRATLRTGEVPHDLVTAVEQQAEGLPLAVEEIIADLVAEGSLVERDGGWTFTASSGRAPPDALRRLVMRRLARLERSTGDVLRAAAVLGREFDWSLLPAITGLDDDVVLNGLGTAAEAQLVTAGDDPATLRFRHALIQSGIAASLLPPERTAIAARAAAVVGGASAESPERLELLARLCEQAGDREGAAQALLSLGSEAVARGALASAESTLERALQLAPQATATSLAALDALADAAERRGAGERSVELAKRAVEGLEAVAAPPSRRLGAWLRVARCSLAVFRPDEARAALDAAETHASTPEECARVEIGRARLAVEMNDMHAAAEHARAVLASSAAREPALECEALYLLGRALRFTEPDPIAGFEPLERMLVIAEGNGLHHWRLTGLLEIGLLDRMTTRRTDRLERARDLALECGAANAATVADINLAMLAQVHDHARAVSLVDHAVVRSRTLGLPTLGLALLLQAAHHAIAGDREAFEAASASSDLQARGGTPFWAFFHDDVEANFPMLDRAWSGARLDRLRSGALAGPHRGLWAVAAAASGQDGARVRSRVCEDGIGSWQIRGCVALAEAIDLGRAGRLHEANEAVAACLRDFGDPHRYTWVEHLVFMWAAPAAHAGGWGDPVTWVRRAREAWRLIGATAQVHACDRILRGLGAAVPRRGRGDATVPTHLRAAGVTSREMDVLLLAAKGMSNREIASRLFMSTRTVETHIGQLLAKTGTRTRSGLAAAARPPVSVGSAEHSS